METEQVGEEIVGGFGDVIVLEEAQRRLRSRHDRRSEDNGDNRSGVDFQRQVGDIGFLLTQVAGGVLNRNLTDRRGGKDHQHDDHQIHQQVDPKVEDPGKHGRIPAGRIDQGVKDAVEFEGHTADDPGKDQD